MVTLYRHVLIKYRELELAPTKESRESEFPPTRKPKNPKESRESEFPPTRKPKNPIVRLRVQVLPLLRSEYSLEYQRHGNHFQRVPIPAIHP